jgi:uncharacterized membrane protein
VQRFEERTTINAPAAKVFDYVSDFTRHGEWSGHGLQVTKEGGGPIGVGTAFSTVAKQFGTQRERSTVTEMTPGSAFGWDSVGGLGNVHHRFAMTEDGGSTTLVKSADVVQPSMLAKFMSWRLRRDIPSSLRNDLVKIKAHLEGSSS